MKRLDVPQEITKRIQIKNVKTGIGHDLMGMYCDIWLDKKKVGYFNDDGWGGEPEIRLPKEAEEKILALLESHHWRYRMFTELGWSFYETEEKISDDSVVQSLIEHLHDLKEKEKQFKKIAKFSEREIVYGTWDNYAHVGFKGGMDLKNMVRAFGREKFQKYIDENIKPKLQEGQQILNPNFEELGLRK